MSEYQPTPKQEQALRAYLHEAVVPLIEDVLVKKLGQAMAYLKEQQRPEQEPCRQDGRCQYAIDHGAEGLGHCPPGKCCMPAPSEQDPVTFPDAPTTIYLQVCDDMGCEEPFCEHHDVSWCEDKINNSDVKYIRADTAPPNREWVELTEKRIHEIWHEQWDAHAGNWAEEFVYHLGKAYEQELKGNNT